MCEETTTFLMYRVRAGWLTGTLRMHTCTATVLRTKRSSETLSSLNTPQSETLLANLLLKFARRVLARDLSENNQHLTNLFFTYYDTPIFRHPFFLFFPLLSYFLYSPLNPSVHPATKILPQSFK